MKKTNIGLVEYIKKEMKKPNIYLLSGFGRMFDTAQLNASARMNSFTVNNMGFYNRYVNKGYKAFDCIGLIKAYLWDEKDGRVNYNTPAGTDQNCRMVYNQAKVKGNIKDMPDVIGMLAMTADLGHVGVYIGKDKNGVRQYIETTPNWHVTGEWGIVQSNDNTRKWAYYCEYPHIEYIKGGSSGKPKLTVEQAAQQIYRGQGGWGTDPQRAKKLKAAGLDAVAVQNRVNELMRVNRKPSKPKPKPKPSKPKEKWLKIPTTIGSYNYYDPKLPAWKKVHGNQMGTLRPKNYAHQAPYIEYKVIAEKGDFTTVQLHGKDPNPHIDIFTGAGTSHAWTKYYK